MVRGAVGIAARGKEGLSLGFFVGRIWRLISGFVDAFAIAVAASLMGLSEFILSVYIVRPCRPLPTLIRAPTLADVLCTGVGDCSSLCGSINPMIFDMERFGVSGIKEVCTIRFSYIGLVPRRAPHFRMVQSF